MFDMIFEWKDLMLSFQNKPDRKPINSETSLSMESHLFWTYNSESQAQKYQEWNHNKHVGIMHKKICPNPKYAVTFLQSINIYYLMSKIDVFNCIQNFHPVLKFTQKFKILSTFTHANQDFPSSSKYKWRYLKWNLRDLCSSIRFLKV